MIGSNPFGCRVTQIGSNNLFRRMAKYFLKLLIKSIKTHFCGKYSTNTPDSFLASDQKPHFTINISHWGSWNPDFTLGD